jgi:hypothetical protein
MTQSDGVNLGFAVDVVQGDALTYTCDVLAVKHSARSGGLGAQVRKQLSDTQELDGMLPGAEEYRFFPGKGVAQAEMILMVGSPPVFSLRYPQLRDLARRFLYELWKEGVAVRHMATTMHGVRTGAGLDEVETFRALLLGLSDAYEAGEYPPMLERITFVEQDESRGRLMQEALRQFYPRAPALARDARRETATVAGSRPDSFRRFASPSRRNHAAYLRGDAVQGRFTTSSAANQPTVREMGCLCERMDLDLYRRHREPDARAHPHRPDDDRCWTAESGVYLEVGYAWKSTPRRCWWRTRASSTRDIRGNRVLIYDKIYRLKQMLADELNRLSG